MKKVFTFLSVLLLSFSIFGCDNSKTTTSTQTSTQTSEQIFYVVFASNGGNPFETLEVTLDSTISLPIPVKDGYTFMGWYTSDDTHFTNYSKITENTILYASWQINSYTISFNSNEGTTITSITQEYGTEISEPSTPVKQGYTFDGWYSDSDFNNVFTFSIMPSNDTLLYAKWIINSYTLAFLDDDGSLLHTQDYPYLTDLSTIIPPLPSKEGYHFIGWDISIPSIMPSNDLSLTAVYSVNQYSISFESYSETSVSTITQDFGTTVVDPITPMKEGYTFDGWYIDSEFSSLYVFSTMPSSDITLYAKWIANLVEVTYVLNNGEANIIELNYMGSNLLNPTSIGYVFEGWYIDTELTQEIDAYSFPAVNTVLYAKWSLVTYNITYILDSGINNINNLDTYTILSNDFTYQVPTKEGYTFIGWYDNPDFTGNIVETLLKGSYGNRTLYAKWEMNQYHVSYYTYDNYNSLDTIILLPGETIVSVSLGGSHSALLTSNGRVFTWGKNNFGQLGDGTVIDKLSPIDITNKFSLLVDEKIISITLGDNHSSALTSNGRLFIWGSNEYGQIGNSTLIKRISPTDITSFFMLSINETIEYVSLGKTHSAALTSDGRVFTWGNNYSGQLGDGTGVNRNVPTEITDQFSLPEGENILCILIGGFHSSAITTSGRVFIWGNNYYGQLGVGTTSNKYIPTEIQDRFNLTEGETVVSISLGASHSSLATSNNRVFTWGYNYNGQLGDGTTTDKVSPIDITLRFNLFEGETVISVSLGSGGYGTSSLLTSKGRLFTWGPNNSGQLGLGTTTVSSNSTPNDITNRISLNEGEVIVDISLGNYHSSIITSNGTIFIWGDNYYGELGNGTTEDNNTPIEIPTVQPLFSHSDSFDYSAFITEYIPIKEGYTFNGWYSDPDLTSLYTLNTMPSNDLVLYGSWSLIE